MSYIPSYAYNKEIMDYIDNLFMDDGYTSYYKLPDTEQEKLAALCMIALGDSAYEAIVEHNDFDGVIAELIRYLQKGTTECARDLADHLRNNTRDYFATTLALLFEERVAVLECERKREAGLHPITDHINGEVRWIR